MKKNIKEAERLWEKFERKMKRSKKLRTQIRASVLEETIGERTAPYAKWKKFAARLKKIIEETPIVVHRTRNGWSYCFKDTGSFASFADWCYRMGADSVYRGIKAAYMRGEVKTVEDVLEAEQEAARRAREPFDRTKKKRIRIYEKAAKLWENTPGLSMAQAFREYFPENDENFETALRSFRNYIKRNKITQRRKVEFPKIGNSKVLELR